MSAFVIAFLTFTDESRYRSYGGRFAEVFRQFEGELLAADESPETLEGAPLDKVVLMRFPDVEAARRFLDSDAYAAISQDRLAGASAHAVLIQSLSRSRSASAVVAS